MTDQSNRAWKILASQIYPVIRRPHTYPIGIGLEIGTD